MHYYAIRAVNLALATAWTFALVAVLVRTLGKDDYALVAVVSGLGGYLMLADFGFSSVVYAKTRKRVLEGEEQSDLGMSFRFLLFYAFLSATATALFAALITLGQYGSPELRAALILHFAGLVCALPWAIVRVTAAATDRYMLFESVEMTRRLLALLLVVAIWSGLSFFGYALLTLTLWLISFTTLLWFVPILSAFRSEDGIKPRVLLRDLGLDIRNGRSAGAFSVLDGFVYNFPYLVVPSLFGTASSVVIFDMFYKVLRFGASAFLAASEAMLPKQTAALLSGDKPTLKQFTMLSLALCAVPAMIGGALAILFGDIIFGAILNDDSLISLDINICMAVALGAMAVQTVAGTLLVNTGQQRDLSRIAIGVVSTMAIFSMAVYAVDLSFTMFIIGWTAIFSCGALAYMGLLIMKLRRLPQSTAQLRFWG